VLGVGPRGVALWVDGAPEPRVWVVIRHTDIAAICERRAVLSSYLSVHGSGRQLPLRYHAVHRHLLDDLLIRLRQQATGAERATPQVLVEPDRWPGRWHAGTASTTVRLGRDPAMAAAFGRLPARRHRPACDCLVALTADELVVARSPDRAGSTADRLYVAAVPSAPGGGGRARTAGAHARRRVRHHPRPGDDPVGVRRPRPGVQPEHPLSGELSTTAIATTDVSAAEGASEMAAVSDSEVLLCWRALRHFRSGRRPACAPRGRPAVSECPLYDACPRWHGQPDDYLAALDEDQRETERRRGSWPCSRLLDLLGPEVHRIGGR